MICDRVLESLVVSQNKDFTARNLTFITLSSFSDPVTPLILSLWSNWTTSRSTLPLSSRRVAHTHQTRETLERPGYSDTRVDLDQDPSNRMDVNLEQARLVQRGVEQGQ